MIDRKEIAEVLMLRDTVRKAIKVVHRRRAAHLMETKSQEKELRSIIRGLIKEGQSAVAAVAKHDSTGINALEDLLRNSNLLSVLETGYKSLTTDIQQRTSYKNHILSAIGLSLAPEESRKGAGEDVEITEDVDIEIGGPEDDPDFIDVEDDGEEEEEVEVDEKEEFGLNGEDKTGRNRAFTDFHNVEKNILTTFDDLDNPEDIAMFEEYLIKNLSLYFDKFENELSVDVEAPAIADDAEAGGPGTASSAPEDIEPEDDIANIELEEVLKHLNIDDIIKNLL
tara:strand:+ start:5203 stop:6048 length:846 start_codon:yes stop_codon:yes gene_type:complete